MVETDLKGAVRDVLDLLNAELRHRAIELDLDFPKRPMKVIGDRTQLQQVVLNLIMNSAEAMSSCSKERRIGIGCAPDDQQFVRLSVSDTGRGISRWITFSKRFTARRPRASGWGFRSAARSSRRMAGGSGRRLHRVRLARC